MARKFGAASIASRFRPALRVITAAAFPISDATVAMSDFRRKPRRESGSTQQPIGNGVDRLYDQTDSFAAGAQ
jgi:hypothetical protein